MTEFSKENYLRCFIVGLTTLIAFTKVSLALSVIYKEGKVVYVLDRMFMGFKAADYEHAPI